MFVSATFFSYLCIGFVVVGMIAPSMWCECIILKPLKQKEKRDIG